VDKWAAAVDNRDDVGKTVRMAAASLGMTRGERVSVRGLCVDWHILDWAGTVPYGEMWMGYPHAVRAETGVQTRDWGVIPTVPASTAETGFLSPMKINSCGRR
jgi:hypothetical protein